MYWKIIKRTLYQGTGEHHDYYQNLRMFSKITALPLGNLSTATSIEYISLIHRGKTMALLE